MRAGETDVVSVQVLIERTIKLRGKTVDQAFDQDCGAWFTTANSNKYRTDVNPKSKKTFRLTGIKAGKYNLTVGTMNNGAKSSGGVTRFTIR